MAFVELRTVANELLYSTVRLETGGPNGIGSGTAFLFTYEQPEGLVPFMVTNRHVISGAAQGRFFFTEGSGTSPKVGSRVDIEMGNFEGEWHPHPDPTIDLAVMPFARVIDHVQLLGKPIYFRTIPHSLIPSTEQLTIFNVFSEVFFVGYPNGIYDQTNLVPITRWGTTATPPSIDYDGRPVVLIDASVFPGSSGSPVFIISRGPFQQGNRISFAPRAYFLGVVSEVMVRTETGRIEFIAAPTALLPIPVVKEMIDLGLIYRSSEVLTAVLHCLNLSKPL